MRAVNLLPKDEARDRRGLPSPWVMLSAAAPLLAGSVVYLGYSREHASLVDKRGELSAVRARLATVKSATSMAAAQTSLVGERTKRQLALEDALAKVMPWDVTLDDLARVIPKDVWLTTLTAASPTPAGVVATTTAPAAPNPSGFTLSGYAHSQDAVAHLLARLRLLPMLGNVALGSTSAATGDTGNGLVQFQVTASVQAMPKASSL
jgi:Tfp pilus assembly protein PilN